MPRGRRGIGQRSRGGHFGEVMVTDSVRIGVNLALKNFRHQEEETELEFPTSLGRTERAYVHKMAAELGFKSKSRDQGQNRYITVYKTEGSSIVAQDSVLSLSQTSSSIIKELFTKYPVSKRERVDVLPISERSITGSGRELVNITRTLGRLATGVPKVPDSWGGKSLLQRRQQLPIWEYRTRIIDTIQNHQVVLVTGDTGSGKTTQVPQFLLEDAFSQQKPVRIVVCEPRRLAVTTVSERVAQERDEQLGQTVGYQIRLDSCTSPRNLLTFCTYGVLLRSLMGGDQISHSLTHIIVDEVHERDKLSDFLLTVLRDMAERSPNLKIVLMSATVDSQQFLQYFPGCVQVSVPGRMFPVKEFYLEDVLQLVNFKGLKGQRSAEQRSKLFVEATSSLTLQDDDVFVEAGGKEDDKQIDKLLGSCFLDGSPGKMLELQNILEADISRLNYQHSQTGVTILMVAAAWGAVDLLYFALSLGVHLHMRATNGWTALEFAKSTNQAESMRILEQSLVLQDDFVDCKDDVARQEVEAGTTGRSKQLTEEERSLLESYQNVFDDEDVDHGLIVDLVLHLTSQPTGAILVFLPGYEDILSIRDMLLEDKRLKKLSVLMLHSQMAAADHRKAFEPSRAGERKVVLSTNIAETGVTLNDVVYVIDSGKVKEKTFDALTNSSMLKSDWISHSSATQRKGRAGRCQPGHVYRLFSSIRYGHLSPYQTPEILRTPLLELCLQTKLLAPPNTPIADFLARVPEPPPFLVTRNAVQALKTLEALDQWEEVTPLGSHLLDIPLDPVLGKILLCGVALKCLDPVLTICCCLSYRDPFLIPSDQRSKKISDATRKRLAGNTYSDHHALLAAFQEWDLAKQTGKGRSWCSKNNVSASTMEMIAGMKTQVLSHLKQSGFVSARAGGGYNSSTYNQYNVHSNNWSMVKACLVAGLYPNLARYDREAGQLRTCRESKVKIHPGSVCADLNKKIKTGGLPSDWLVYTEMTRAGRSAYIRGISFISPICVGLFCGPSRLPASVWEVGERTGQINHFIEESSDSEEEEHSPEHSVIINLDPWISLRTNTQSAQKILQLRQKWTVLWFKKLSSLHRTGDDCDTMVVGGLGEVLVSEDESQGLVTPQPRAMSRSSTSESSDRPKVAESPKPRRESNDAISLAPRVAGPPTSYLIVRPSAGSSLALEAAKSHGKTAVWSFSPAVERKLIGELQSGKAVVVFFNISGTRLLQGCAVLTGQIVREGNRVGQRIEWIGKQSLDMTYLSSILGNTDLQQGKDVLEIPSDVAQPLLNRMNALDTSGYTRGSDWVRRGKFGPFRQ